MWVQQDNGRPQISYTCTSRPSSFIAEGVEAKYLSAFFDERPRVVLALPSRPSRAATVFA